MRTFSMKQLFCTHSVIVFETYFLLLLIYLCISSNKAPHTKCSITSPKQYHQLEPVGATISSQPQRLPQYLGYIPSPQLRHPSVRPCVSSLFSLSKRSSAWRFPLVPAFSVPSLALASLAFSGAFAPMAGSPNHISFTMLVSDH